MKILYIFGGNPFVFSKNFGNPFVLVEISYAISKSDLPVEDAVNQNSVNQRLYQLCS